MYICSYVLCTLLKLILLLTELENQTNYTNDVNEPQSELNITVLAENIRTTCQLFKVLNIK